LTGHARQHKKGSGGDFHIPQKHATRVKTPGRKKSFLEQRAPTKQRPKAKKSATNPSRHPVASFSIVGVGASAGGLEAFTELLKHLPADIGLGFVLVQHLDPQHESALTQILARATSLPVREVTNNLRVKINHVYVIPPNTTLAIDQGVLKLQPRLQVRTPTRSIDFFLESLAQDQRERAIGVILSGTANDGTLGLEAIKAEGGITFAQDGSAKYDSMPRSAVDARCVDFVLRPQDIAKELVRIAKHPLVVNPSGLLAPGLRSEAEREADQLENPEAPLASGGQGRPPTGAEKARAEANAQRGQPPVAADENFKKILLLLRNHGAVDFSLYKSTTIHRRITRRMVLSKHNSAEDYAQFLRGNTKELYALYSDCLISVTSFFRNPEAFEVLKHKVFPALIQKRNDAPLRIWVLGCSTGQEAYSIAMTYMEAAGKAPHVRKLQVFATDVNDALLDKARHGLYSKTLAQDLSPERLRRFFVEEEGGYRIIKPLRESVVFARHNLMNDPPFSRIDLVSCRNLLIYLEPSLQDKALPMFHYSLKPGGFLFLGTSESVGNLTELFEPVDKKHKIYCKKAAPTPDFRLTLKKRPGEQPSSSPASQVTAMPEVGGQFAVLRGELSAQREADRIVVNRYSPPAVLIDANLHILQFRGSTNAFLQLPPSGKATLDVLKMAREGLMLPLRAAINKAKKENRTARRENVAVKEKGGTRMVNFEVVPLSNLSEPCYLISFEEAKNLRKQTQRKEAQASLPSLPRVKTSRQIAALQRELSETRDYLESIQEQHEAANEELQASSEEVQSANEELQSLNEELETSKEELESSNEELTTVNEEMSNRNAELNRLNSDFNNLQTSTKLAIVVLGRDLTIRRFSPQAQKQFNLLDTDIGRPFTGVQHQLDVPHLETVLAEVIANIRETEREVRDKDGRWFYLRVRPYLTFENKVDGAVLVMQDIDALKRAEQKATAAYLYARTIIDDSPPLLVLDTQLRVLSSNESFYRHFKVSPADTENVLVYELGNGQWNIPKLRTFLQDILPRNSLFKDFEIVHEFELIGRRTMLLKGHRLDHAQQILLFIDDITEQVEARDKVRASELRYRGLFETSTDGIVILDAETGKVTEANPSMTKLLGYPRDELIGKELWELGFSSDQRANKAAFLELQKHHFVRYDDLPLKTKDRRTIQVEFVSNLFHENENAVIQCNIRDITDRKQAEKRLRVAQAQLSDRAAQLEQLVAEGTAKLQDTISELEHFSYTITHDMRAPLRAMQGFGALLLDRYAAELTPKSSDYLRRIAHAADRMDALIRDSLQYAKVVREKLPLESVDPASVLRGVLESYPELQEPEVIIQVVEPMPAIIANETGLAQCFSNILVNAVKFVKPGQVPEVRIWAEVEEAPHPGSTDPAIQQSDSNSPETQQSRPPAVVRFLFEDNGIGIPLEYRDRIFRMFQQLDKSYDGTGIGLALVRKTAERMQGRVGVESEVGKGSRFWLEFKKASTDPLTH
jgi:two-component system, chemotaxis family, CheB/CheR fusion protein